MQVREAMARTISTAAPGDTLQRVAQLMKQEDAGFIPVVEGDSLRGVITDRDIVLRCLAEGHDVLHERADHCMTRDVATVDAGADISEAARLMESRAIRRLPVMEGGRVVGVLSHGNLVQATHSEGPGDMATLGVTKGA
ncbi:MAG: CBS domain-containing protein [Dehalococcoidia bacterium]